MLSYSMQDVFENWVSVKEFDDREVEKQKLHEIFSDTTKAPTAFNLQPYSFKVIDSEEAFQGVIELLISENSWVGEADKIVLLIGDERLDSNLERTMQNMGENSLPNSKKESYRERIESYTERSEGFRRRWLIRNTMIPAAFFMLSCVKHGVGCCPVKGFNEDDVAEFLELESYERPQLMIPIGYPKEEPERSWRRPAEEIYEII